MENLQDCTKLAERHSKRSSGPSISVTSVPSLINHLTTDLSRCERAGNQSEFEVVQNFCVAASEFTEGD